MAAIPTNAPTSTPSLRPTAGSKTDNPTSSSMVAPIAVTYPPITQPPTFATSAQTSESLSPTISVFGILGTPIPVDVVISVLGDKTTPPSTLPTSLPVMATNVPTGKEPTEQPTLIPALSQEEILTPRPTSVQTSQPPTSVVPTSTPQVSSVTTPMPIPVTTPMPIEPVTQTPSTFPVSTPPTSIAPTNTNSAHYCGCPSCTSSVWNADADTFSCGERIEYIVYSLGGSWEAACRQVAGQEFPQRCGPFCDPDACHSLTVNSGITPDQDVDHPLTAVPTAILSGTGAEPTIVPLKTTMRPSISPTQLPIATPILNPTRESTEAPSGAFFAVSNDEPDAADLPLETDNGGTTGINAKPGLSAGLHTESPSVRPSPEVDWPSVLITSAATRMSSASCVAALVGLMVAFCGFWVS
ncbi:expressed unknown protein [Seminavis robusta]|uniref:Uncharacterized protein n=1 Tax=Seminavis robusta TaxID=568900 RepID=A0A9N8HVR8_9STRA|nr:expressed unknown protein [Seminavis robusta]|eukprot:Sro2034_g311970.1 n/a (412) ;mRNA; r:3606-4841